MHGPSWTTHSVGRSGKELSRQASRDGERYLRWLIFGDSLLALKTLEQEFAGKVKAVCSHA